MSECAGAIFRAMLVFLRKQVSPSDKGDVGTKVSELLRLYADV